MRLATDKGDPGFPAWRRAIALGRKITVTVDGIEQNSCLMADEEEGQVRRCVLADDGGIQVDPDKPDEVWTEIARGEVRITLGPKGSDI